MQKVVVGAGHGEGKVDARGGVGASGHETHGWCGWGLCGGCKGEGDLWGKVEIGRRE